MNRSKIFLGATTCLLAIAGVAATKVAKFKIATVTYFTQVVPIGPRACVSATQQPCTAGPSGTVRCYYYTTGPFHTVTSFPLYTGVNASTPCVNPIKYNAL